jgi:hypothetical protein
MKTFLLCPLLRREGRAKTKKKMLQLRPWLWSSSFPRFLCGFGFAVHKRMLSAGAAAIAGPPSYVGLSAKGLGRVPCSPTSPTPGPRAFLKLYTNSWNGTKKFSRKGPRKLGNGFHIYFGNVSLRGPYLLPSVKTRPFPLVSTIGPNDGTPIWKVFREISCTLRASLYQQISLQEERR